MEGLIKMIPVGCIYPHPENPRKDIGDIKELTASIRANGVLQNLTVIPHVDGFEDCYTVVIGHRRLAAAKAAGLSSVPCIVTKMDRKEQQRTMLMENMQRSDLTVWEQAQGFQLMLDLGDDIKTIAKDSGFSEKTIKQRVKIAKYNKVSVDHALERGATIQDFIKLEKIEDPLVKDELIEKYIGTNNFEEKVKTAIKAQETAKIISAWEKDISTWAEKIEDDIPKYFKYITSAAPYSSKKAPQKPTAAGSGAKYYYKINSPGTTWTSIFIYMDVKDCKDAKEAAQIAAQEEAAKRREKAERYRNRCDMFISTRAQLRSDFINSLDEKDLKPYGGEIVSALYGIEEANRFGHSRMAECIFLNTIGLPAATDNADVVINKIAEKAKNEPLKTLMLIAIRNGLVFQSNVTYDWTSRYSASLPCWCEVENKAATKLLQLLDTFGYQKSDDEIRIEAGTHEVFDLHKEAKRKA